MKFVMSSGRPSTILPVTQRKPEAARGVMFSDQKESMGSTIRK